MLSPKEMYDYYVHGDRIDGDSLIEGVIYYKDLTDRLVKCGPVFYLAYKEAHRLYYGLRDQAVARKLPLPNGV